MKARLALAIVAGGATFEVAPLVAQSAAPAIDTGLARLYLAEAAVLTARDGGRLWGRSLAGPLLFVHRGTRATVRDQSPSGVPVSAGDGLFHATLPESEPVANTSLRWAGISWAMVVWPPSTDSLRRRVLLAHELWHRAQDSLGFPGSMPANAHLGTRDGRVWLRLEARALLAALRAPGTARTRAAGDALAFRRARHQRFPAAAAEERRLELNEGLAEYTGIALAAPDDSTRLALTRQRLASLDSAPNFEREFAYHTGPAWGLLLDELSPSWRRALTDSDDLALLAGAALPAGVRAARADTRGAAYGMVAIRKAETARAAAREKRVRDLRTRFVTGPRLELPLAEMKLGFDPGQVEALEDGGSVYGMLRLSDRWGVLQCDASGGFISADFSRAIVPAPSDTTGRRLTGPGWILELATGWRIVRGSRPGDWTITRDGGSSP